MEMTLHTHELLDMIETLHTRITRLEMHGINPQNRWLPEKSVNLSGLSPQEMKDIVRNKLDKVKVVILTQLQKMASFTQVDPNPNGDLDLLFKGPHNWFVNVGYIRHSEEYQILVYHKIGHDGHRRSWESDFFTKNPEEFDLVKAIQYEVPHFSARVPLRHDPLPRGF